MSWVIAARTATAVGAVDWATERSSQLGQRTTDSMAAARWAAVGGDEVRTPLPDDQGHDEHHAQAPSTAGIVARSPCRTRWPRPWP